MTEEKRNSHGTSILVISGNIINVRVLFAANGQIALANKASLHIGILGQQSAHLTLHIAILQVSRRILNLDYGIPAIVILIRLPGDLVTVGILAQDDGSLGEIFG